ncbi:MAG: hypothetical protein Fur0022_17680 [Anaerolineales bacterium]
MKSKLSGLFAGINRLKYPQKFTLISLLFIIPLLAFFPVIIEQVTRTQQYGTYELYGTYYLQPLQDLLEHVQEHKRLRIEQLQGLATPEQVSQVREKIQQDFNQLDGYHAQYADELRLTSELSALKEQWKVLAENETSQTDAQITLAHVGLEDAILNLIRYVGDTSFLILDPELDTYYLMETILLRLPYSQRTLDQIRTISTKVLSENNISVSDQTFLVVLTNQLSEDIVALQNSIGVSIQNNETGQFASLLNAPLQEYVEAANEFLAYVDGISSGGQSLTATQEELTALADQAQAAHTSFYDTASETLIIGINNRIVRYSRIAYIPGTVGLLSILIGFWIGITIMRRISRPLSELALATGQMASGDLSARVHVITDDEVGQVGLAFNQMAQTLETSQTRLTKSAEISRQLSAITDPDKLVQEVVEQVKSAFNYDYVHMYLFQDDKQTLQIIRDTGESGKMTLESEQAAAFETSIVGRAVRTQQPVLIPDHQTPPAWLPDGLLPNIKAEIAVPVIFGQEVLGVLAVHNTVSNSLSEADVELLQSIASQTATALQNAFTLKQFVDRSEALAVSQQLFKTILETAPVPFLISSVIDGKVLYANEQLGLLLGIPVSEVIGRQTPDFYYDPADRTILLNKVRQDGFVKNYEIHVKKADGTPFWVSASLQPIRYENTPALLAAFYDLTDRKTYEERLAQRAERDRILNRISTKIRSAASMEQVLQIVAQEVRESYNASRAVIQILPEALPRQN